MAEGRKFSEIVERMSQLIRDQRITDAARLLPELGAADRDITADELGRWPVCVKCLGYGEVNDPGQEGRKLSCIVHAAHCVGNQMGRMSPDQFIDYAKSLLPKVDDAGHVVPPVASGPQVEEQTPTKAAPTHFGPAHPDPRPSSPEAP